MATVEEKQRRFWEYNINSHSGFRDYPYSYIEKARIEKKLSKQKTQEKRRLKELEKLN